MSRNAGIIGGRRSANTTVAGGIWDLTTQQQEKGASNWVLSSTPTLEYLVIAGGGGGGNGSGWAYGGGGGGAGGYRTSVPGSTSGQNSSAESLFTVTSGIAYTVTVGGGGAGAGGGTGSNGGNSVFSSVTSTGGGGRSRSIKWTKWRCNNSVFWWFGRWRW